MSRSAAVVVFIVGLIHVGILVGEAFFWDRMGARLMGTDDATLLATTAPMALNQGLYNGFLAAGLFWSLMISDAGWSRNVGVFFLLCVAVAGIVGALTVRPSILVVQTVPAVIGLVLLQTRRKSAQG